MKKIIFIALLFVLACRNEPIGGQTDEYGCLTPAGYSWNSNMGACVREWELDESQMEAAKMVVAPMSYRPVTVAKVETLRCPGCFDVYLQNNDAQTKMMVRDWRIYHEDVADCEVDSDCVPMPVCHPHACINKDFVSRYEKPEACTEIFYYTAAYNPEDCICVNNECTNKNIKELTPEECIQEGGRTLNVVGGETCDEHEDNLGDVVGFISPNICCKPWNTTLTLAEAKEIAESCEGDLTSEWFYNPNSRTWWFQTDLVQEACNPACVVDELDQSAKINWRCAGLD